MREQDKIDHLLRRTGFCCTPAQRKQAHREGYGATVESILQRSLAYRLKEDPPPVVAPAVVLPVTFLTFGEGILWWMRTLARTGSPLNERLTLFWHRHFATSGAKVFRPGWMFQQNQTFREYGMGSFSELLGQMVKDPALLKWLDADDNPADHPNENLARELMELFTLGIGHFTEHDVKELAKLTTGKRLTFGGRTPAQPKGAYTGPVSLLGFKGQTDLAETASRLAVHEATANRLVGLLWDDFVAGPLAAGERAQLAALWSKTRGNVAVVLRRIFHSPSFFCAPRQRVLSPVEFWTACCRLTETSDFRLDDAKQLEEAGEQLFFPSSVKGWDQGIAWIHPAAFQSRLEIAQRVVARLPKGHFALRGLAGARDRGRYLEYITGGQVRATNVPANLAKFEPRQALTLALAGPDMWLV